MPGRSLLHSRPEPAPTRQFVTRLRHDPREARAPLPSAEIVVYGLWNNIDRLPETEPPALSALNRTIAKVTKALEAGSRILPRVNPQWASSLLNDLRPALCVHRLRGDGQQPTLVTARSTRRSGSASGYAQRLLGRDARSAGHATGASAPMESRSSGGCASRRTRR